MTSRTTVAAMLVAGLAGASSAAAQRGPAATATKLPAEVLALACAPKVAFDQPDTPLRVTGGQDSFVRRIHAPGDLITINAGKQNGIEVGQEFYTRRVMVSERERVTRLTPGTIATSGWIRVWAVDDEWSLATITHACDSIEIGDHLEPFALPTLPVISPDKPKAERDNYGHVMRGSDRRSVFGRGDFILVDRGSDHGVTPGAQFVLYRNKEQPLNFLYELGEAVAMSVTPSTSTLQITLFRDSIEEGDLVAIRKQPEPATDANE